VDPVELMHVGPDYLDLYWSRVERALTWKVARVVARLGVLHAAVMAGTRELWVAHRAGFPTQLSSVIVTTIVTLPREPKTLKVELLSGRHAGTWIDSAACTLSRYAQAHGCTRLWIVGRLGWRHYRDRFPLPVIWTCDRESSRADHANQYH
jgi:hypothetical protein